MECKHKVLECSDLMKNHPLPNAVFLLECVNCERIVGNAKWRECGDNLVVELSCSVPQIDRIINLPKDILNFRGGNHVQI